MKSKNNLVVLISSSIVCLLPLILSAMLYKDLPGQIAIHWNSAGIPDRLVPKGAAAFGLPFLFLAINLFSKLRLNYDPKRSNTSRTVQTLVAWMPPTLSLVLVPVTLFIAMGVPISISLAAPVLTGILLIVFGNYLPKSRQNYTIGIKLPWTLHDADNWNKTHRMAGYLYILAGILLVAFTFFAGKSRAFSGVFIAVPIVLVMVPLGYSFFLYQKCSANREETDD